MATKRGDPYGWHWQDVAVSPTSTTALVVTARFETCWDRLERALRDLQEAARG